MLKKNIKELDKKIEIARDHYDTDNYQKSIKEFNKALSLSRKFNLLNEIQYSNILSELGYAYYDSNKYSYAEEVLVKALKLNEDIDNKPVVYQMLGTVYYHLDDYKNSIKYRKLAKPLILNEYENEFGIIYELGCSYFRNSDYKLAEKNFEEFLKKYTKGTLLVWAIYFLGCTKFGLNKDKEAEKMFKLVIEKNPSDESLLIKVYYRLANLYYFNGNIKDLDFVVEKLLIISNDFYDIESILFYQILCYADKKYIKKLKYCLSEFVKRFPKSKYLIEFNEFIEINKKL